jgi:ribose 5-phosphate isomerase A
MAFIMALGQLFQQGLKVSGVATSPESAELAGRYGIPILELEEGVVLDIVVDGADEVAPNLDLVKGWGAALVWERIVTAASRRQVILVGPEKLVRKIGERGRIPVEIIPKAVGYATGRLKALGLTPMVRLAKTGGALISANHNLILDCAPAKPLEDRTAAKDLEAGILDIPGVVDTGLFLGTAERVIIGRSDGSVEVRTRGA